MSIQPVLVDTDSLGVRGGATPDELAAVVAALARAARQPAAVEPYEQWRHNRIRALRAMPYDTPPAANR